MNRITVFCGSSAGTDDHYMEQANGRVIGVLPDFLSSKEIAYQGLTELIIVETMHQRKTKMNDLCDGVLPCPEALGPWRIFLKC